MLQVLFLAAQLQISPSVTLMCTPDCVMPAPSERLYEEYKPEKKAAKVKRLPQKKKNKRGGERVKYLGGGPWVNTN